jgi:hypothetical protein
VFASVGIQTSDVEQLREALIQAATNAEARLGTIDSFGQRYSIEFEWTRGAQTARIRSTWILLSGQDQPRLTTCYVL